MGAAADEELARRIRVTGNVQGVGFRPTVWRIATEEGLIGRVYNDAAGVVIEVAGARAAVERFCERLGREPPPLARIDALEFSTASFVRRPGQFVIEESRGGEIATGIVPDAATCPACLAEVLDPENRRHAYAFTNCTHCGPRLTIVRAIPYDRANTSMSAFPMCPRCQSEYDDPADRRFHAQPNACPDCGPRLWLEDAGGRALDGDAIERAAALVASGAILAIKGLGGFHLACDARNPEAVCELRRRKARPVKPLAIMVADVAAAEALAHVDAAERALLLSPSAPIVLLERRARAALADDVAPGQRRIGVMLAYTPLHHILLCAVDGPLVMTSGNRSEEPQAITNEDARARLSNIADVFVMHDREIVNRLDDSVVRADRQGPSYLRRARGYAPDHLALPQDFARAPRVLAMGGELKSTFAILRGCTATLSQHLGDLHDVRTFEAFEATLALYRRIYEFTPERIAIDGHPDYMSSRLGRRLARELGVPLMLVQHHHAHLAAVLADNRYPADAGSVLGIVLDGTGLGDDGTIWGGEFLLGGYRRFERVAHFEPFPLIGGEQAAREPWRNAVALLRLGRSMDDVARLGDHAELAWLRQKPLTMIERMIERSINTPHTSSAGRLFDAVAALSGVCRERQSFEGEAGMALEALAGPLMARESGYPVATTGGDRCVLSFRPMIAAIVDDLASGVRPTVIAARFHRGLTAGIAELAASLAAARGTDTVALSGGVFQNRLVLDRLSSDLSVRGLKVLTHRHVPANDGGLSLGQAAIAGLG
ncbi:MAG: carbamoyltransferase HypF [Hyphomicrobiaceae bacterium]|nr:carbamoyltransferase HypF [Hyphomicrobiaceae bacterium]